MLPTGLGAPNGPRLKPFERWFRYPAGFSEDLLDRCLENLAQQPGALLCDPFAGVATSGVYACGAGLSFVGIEAHPLVAELAELKFRRHVNAAALASRAEQVTSECQPGSTTHEPDLITRSFSHETLAYLVGLREAIKAAADDPWHLHLKWCLLATLRDCASVKVGWPYQRPNSPRTPRIVDPARAFLRRAEWMVEDLTAAGAVDARIFVGDSRMEATWASALGGGTIDIVVTSPPYLNNFDYADATRLELYFWGAVRTWSDMVKTVRDGMVIATTQQTRRDVTRQLAKELDTECPVLAFELRRLVTDLRVQRSARPRGKEYDHLAVSYFADLVKVLLRIRAHTVSEAPTIFVLGDSAPYGVYINTPELLACAAEELGYRRERVVTVRRRGQRWNTNGKRHSVPLSEKIVVLRAPGP